MSNLEAICTLSLCKGPNYSLFLFNAILIFFKRRVATLDVSLFILLVGSASVCHNHTLTLKNRRQNPDPVH